MTSGAQAIHVKEGFNPFSLDSQEDSVHSEPAASLGRGTGRVSRSQLPGADLGSPVVQVTPQGPALPAGDVESA